MIRIILTLLILATGTLTYAQGKVSRNSNTSNKVKNSTVTKSNISRSINGHDYVNLGLPNGLKWAICNVGSLSPSYYGFKFRWADTHAYSQTGKCTSDMEYKIYSVIAQYLESSI